LYDTLHDVTDGLDDNFRSIQDSLDIIQERYLMEDMRDEYNQEVYVWYDFEADCDDWYMDSCHFWDENHFHILFDDSTPPFVENINVTHQELVMITNVHPTYFAVVLFLRPFSTIWMDLLIWIHIKGVSIWSIIFGLLVGSKIFHGTFT
jgi:hypothetical protein